MFFGYLVVALFLSTSAFAQWDWKGGGLPEFYGYCEYIKMIGKSGNTLYAAQNNRIFRKLENTDTWTEITDKFPSGARFTELQGNDTRMFVAFYETINSVTHTRIYYSSDNGENWINTGIDKSANITSIAISGDIVLAFYQGIFRSTDNGSTWVDLSALSTPSQGNVIKIIGTDTYLGADHTFHRSTDYGDSWTEVAGVIQTYEGVSSIASSGSKIYLGSKPSVYKSEDNGLTWTRHTNGIPTGVDVLAMFADGSTVLAGFSQSYLNHGVYLSTDSGENWAAFNEGFPNTRTISSMFGYDQYVYAAVSAGLYMNGGVYRRPLSDLVTSVEVTDNVVSFNLSQNFPNPFNPSTKISWQSPVGSHQTIKVYDVLGNEVATLVNEYREAGTYEITFDASQLASGIYLYKLQAGSFVVTKKMIVLK